MPPKRPAEEPANNDPAGGPAGNTRAKTTRKEPPDTNPADTNPAGEPPKKSAWEGPWKPKIGAETSDDEPGRTGGKKPADANLGGSPPDKESNGLKPADEESDDEEVGKGREDEVPEARLKTLHKYKEPHFPLSTKDVKKTGPRRSFLDVSNLDQFKSKELRDACHSVNQPVRGVAKKVLVNTLMTQYRDQALQEKLREELESLGLDTSGSNGFALRKRIDEYGQSGLARNSPGALRTMAKRRGLYCDPKATECDLVFKLLEYELRIAREKCGWSLYLNPETAKQRKERLDKQQKQTDKVAGKVERELRNVKNLRGLRGHENQRFRQRDVEGDGNCLFRAFAHAWFGDETQYKQVKTDAHTVWQLAMNGPNQLSTDRYLIYEQLEQDSRPPPGPKTKKSKDDSTHAVVSKQLSRPNYWGTLESLQVIADTYGVEIFIHILEVSPSDESYKWGVNVRGDHTDANGDPTPQVHLVNYRILSHWTALAPIGDDARFANTFRFTAHTKLSEADQLAMRSPCNFILPEPLPRRKRTDPNDRTPNYLTMKPRPSRKDKTGGSNSGDSSKSDSSNNDSDKSGDPPKKDSPKKGSTKDNPVDLSSKNKNGKNKASGAGPSKTGAAKPKTGGSAKKSTLWTAAKPTGAKKNKSNKSTRKASPKKTLTSTVGGRRSTRLKA